MFYRLAMRSIQARAGISTDKINARPPRRSNAKVGGPMGLAELTSHKWLGSGSGKIRI
jgi:gamma-glutamyl phosphate reductase